MVSISETIVIEKRKSLTEMDELQQPDDNVILRKKIDQPSDDDNDDDDSNNDNHPDDYQINNITKISSILEPDQLNLKSFKSNDLWRLDPTIIAKQVQQNSFVHRNYDESYRELSADGPDICLPIDRPQSLQIVSQNNALPFRRESIIRQSWNNLWKRNKDRKHQKSNTKIKDTNNNSNNKDKDDKDHKKIEDDTVGSEIVKQFERIPSGLFRRGHSRNSSSSSCASYR